MPENTELRIFDPRYHGTREEVEAAEERIRELDRYTHVKVDGPRIQRFRVDVSLNTVGDTVISPRKGGEFPEWLNFGESTEEDGSSRSPKISATLHEEGRLSLRLNNYEYLIHREPIDH